MRIPGEGTEKKKARKPSERWKNKRIWWLCAMKPAQHAARRHASQIAHHLLFIERSHDVTERSIRENAVHSKRGPGWEKKRQNCVSGKRFDYREKCVSFDFGKRNRYSMTFHCEKHQKILLHFQFIGEGGGPIEARKLIAVWFCCSKEINDVWKAKQKLFPSQWIFILLFIFARGKKLFA